MELLKYENDEELKKIVKKLPDNDEVAFDILKSLGNNTTKIQKEKDFTNSYYVFLKDTIYLADNEKNNNGVSRICLLAHECKHSIQSKLLQWLNFVFSNIEMILFFVVFIINIFLKNSVLMYIYLAVSALSILFRAILEFDAVLSSTKISKKYLDSKLTDEESRKLTNVYEKYTKKLLPLFGISLFGWKIIKAILNVIIVFIG